MASCEKCWRDAYTRMRATGRSQTECYGELIRERDDNPCSAEQQAGEFWDEGKQIDIRELPEWRKQYE